MAIKILLLNLAALIILSALAFSRPTERLMNGYDGEYYKVEVRHLAAWGNADLGLSINPFQGMGALSLFNRKISPTYFLFNTTREPVGIQAAYVIAAIEIFIATWLFGLALGFSLKSSLIGGWILAFSILPFFEFAQLYPIANIAPSIAEGLAANTACVALFGLALKGNMRFRLFAALCLSAVTLWSLAARPSGLVLIVPVALSLCLGLLLAVPQEDGRSKRAVLALLPLSLILAAGGAVYFMGIMTDTASAMFPAELNRAVARTPYNVSTAFQSAAHGWLGPVFVSLAALGLLISMRNIEGRSRAKLAALAMLPLLIIAALFFATSGAWPYPLPNYFEFGVYPLYAIYAAEVFVFLARFVPLPSRFPWRFVVLPLLTVSGAGLHLQPMIANADAFSHPPVKNEITNILVDKIALTSPGPFRGYEATFAGYGGQNGPPADWLTLFGNDAKVVQAVGNSMRMLNLWYFDIPTLEEYQPLTTPTFYAVTSRLLTRPGDQQTRNVLMLSNPNLPLLQSMGVRYVIADNVLPAPAVKRAEQAVDGMSSYRLYELPLANRGDYSPTEPIVVSTANEALTEMGKADFDFTRRVVLFAGIGSPLVPASRARMDVLIDGYQIEAESPGQSLLLLPLQYSQCMEIETLHGAPPKLLRANLAQAALLFDKQTRLILRSRLNVFHNSACRFNDGREAQKFGIKAIARSN